MSPVTGVRTGGGTRPGAGLRGLVRHELFGRAAVSWARARSTGPAGAPAHGVPGGAADAAEHHCDLCSEPLPEEHPHLLEVTGQRISCACRACGLLFDRKEAAGGRYRTVPHLRRPLPDLRIDDVVWAGLGVPVRLAFFVRHEPTGDRVEPFVTAHYPSPLGVVGATVDEPAWRRVEEANPGLVEVLDTEVVALLTHRGRDEHWLVGVDDCYRLTARVRHQWSGMTGGDEVWRGIEEFFTGLRAGARRGSGSAGRT